jgi:hypothetical protein
VPVGTLPPYLLMAAGKDIIGFQTCIPLLIPLRNQLGIRRCEAIIRVNTSGHGRGYNHQLWIVIYTFFKLIGSANFRKKSSKKGV